MSPDHLEKLISLDLTREQALEQLYDLAQILDSICWQVRRTFVHNKSDIIKTARERLSKLPKEFQ